MIMAAQPQHGRYERELYAGLIRLHILHHAAEEGVFGLGMIEELGDTVTDSVREPCIRCSIDLRRRGCSFLTSRVRQGKSAGSIGQRKLAGGH